MESESYVYCKQTKYAFQKLHRLEQNTWLMKIKKAAEVDVEPFTEHNKGVFHSS
jgi:hypothetical protein